ncbi:MAG: peptidoglycan-associated lipoprotein Pal [Deltaproteobacteria bacterium]|nr:peptidoglycan-associated lipoprotein Pal [Deltaproteobacteria bacterium]
MRKVMWMGTFVVAGLMMVTGCAQQKRSAGKATDGLNRIHFDFDKSNIKSEFEPVLRNNAAWLQAHSKKNVVVEGHCDERGSNEYNIALGERRANAAKNYLKNLGVAANRMDSISYGEERPMATCHEESCWWQNRRAEFVAK